MLDIYILLIVTCILTHINIANENSKSRID
jgi:hypothetical protein